MRFSTVAAAVCLSLLIAAGLAAEGAGTPAAVPPAAVPPADAAPAAASPASDAAAKHTKRTACLKNAKSKKLVGADKTSFLKACVAAP